MKNWEWNFVCQLLCLNDIRIEHFPLMFHMKWRQFQAHVFTFIHQITFICDQNKFNDISNSRSFINLLRTFQTQMFGNFDKQNCTRKLKMRRNFIQNAWRVHLMIIKDNSFDFVYLPMKKFQVLNHWFNSIIDILDDNLVTGFQVNNSKNVRSRRPRLK